MRFKKPIYFIFTALFLSGCSNPITESSRERGRLNSDHYYDVIFGYELNADRSGYVLKNVHTNCYYGTVTVPEFYQGLPVVEIGNQAFYNCVNLSGIELPNSLQKIEKYAFYCCSGITSLNIPDSVTYIGEGAFSSCSNLKKLSLGSGVQTIENYNFIYHCERLVDITVKDDNPYFYGEEGLLYTKEDKALFATAPGSPGDINIKNGTKRIKKGAFYALTSINSVTIPASVEIIDDETFHGSSKLRSINVNSSNANYASVDGVLYNKAVSELICYPCFKRCESFTVPNTVKKIVKYSFGYCRGLGELTLPEGVEIIAEGAFRYAQYLRKINIPSTLLTIEDYAFYGCGVSFINLSSKITRIESHLFRGTSALESIVLPKTLRYIDAMAFDDSYDLRAIYFEGSKEEFDSIAVDSGLNDYFGRATKLFYSETEPTTEGNYWHYVDNVPVKW